MSIQEFYSVMTDLWDRLALAESAEQHPPTTLFPPQENKLHTKIGIDECSFCKHKDHWKAQYPKLANRAYQPKPPHMGQPPTSTSGMAPSTCILDSGASHHMP
uniref:Uncharacterized protein n=1 Tax=Cannabis sativa TaxID=3483 RepID=A0A803NYN8_CANSA